MNLAAMASDQQGIESVNHIKKSVDLIANLKPSYTGSDGMRCGSLGNFDRHSRHFRVR